MQPRLVVLVLLLPVLFWAAYHYYKDRERPEPVMNLVICLLAGVAAAWGGRFLYMTLDRLGLRYDAFELAAQSPAGLLAYAIAGIGLVEEFAKFVPFLLLVPFFRDFDEPLDGIIYASFVALGFAAVENVHYSEYLRAGASIARGFASPIVHILFASIWGYYTGRALLAGRRRVRTAALSLSVAAALHGLYDFLVIMNHETFLPAAATLILVIWLWRMRLIRELGRDAAVRTE